MRGRIQIKAQLQRGFGKLLASVLYFDGCRR
jgi:hypothetical protein